MGVAVPSVVLLLPSRSRAATALSRGGCDWGVVAAASVPEGIRSSNHHHGCLVAYGTSCMEDSSWIKKTEKKKICVRTDSMREMLFEFSHDNAGLETLHFHGEPKQFKIRLPLAFAELPKQNNYQKIKRLIRIITDIPCV